MAVRTDNKISEWVSFFLEGVIETADNGTRTLSDILDLQKEYEDMTRALGARAANATKHTLGNINPHFLRIFFGGPKTLRYLCGATRC